MKRAKLSSSWLLTFITLALLAAGLWAQTPDRFFDTAGPPAGQVRLVIFYPSLGTITDLVALKDNGLFPADKLGKGFRVAATSLDGKVTEAIEHERYPNVLGVQFHPEFSMLWNTEPKYKFTPQDKDLIGIKPYLESHAPSFEFHKKLWAWFLEKLQTGRSR